MAQEGLSSGTAEPVAAVATDGKASSDWSADRQTFPVHWGKAMMWIFLLSDTFIFSCFLTGYMTVRMSTTDTVAEPERGFRVNDVRRTYSADPDRDHDLCADQQQRNHGHGREFRSPSRQEENILADAGDGRVRRHVRRHAGFRVDQTDRGGRRASVGQPDGRPQFGSSFFMITGFHGMHVSAGVIYLLVVANRVRNGFYDRKGSYDTVEIAGLYWHFVDLVWVFIFAFFYLW